MQRSTRVPRSQGQRSLALALLFFSPLLGIALVRRAAPAPPVAPQEAPEVRAPRPSAELEAELSQPLQYRLALQGSAAAALRLDGAGALVSQSGRRLDGLAELLADEGASLAPLVRLPAARLDALQLRARSRSDDPPVDFLGMFIVEPAGRSLEELERLGGRLQQHALVERAVIQVLGCPPPEDPAPVTPDFSPLQTYRAAGAGLGADYANAYGFLGQGVRISDCEYGWRASHEDLRASALYPEPGQRPDPNVALFGFEDHGTAVAGLLVGARNGFGVKGIAPASELHTYPEWSVEAGFRRVECILSAAADSAPGDVLLLEMQALGAGGHYGPAELDPLVFLAVRLASDAGVIVVAAAGNGAQDLDAPAYQSYRDLGHSGALLVGAGTADDQHERLGFSSYGSRVDLQGWGQAVFSAGYGDHAELGGDLDQRYTARFSGTSSAAALVAGAVAVLQSAQLAGSGQPLDAEGMRSLLQASAAPQGAGGASQLPGAPGALASIGPAPRLREALERLPWVGRVVRHLGSGQNPALLDSPGVPRLGESWRVEFDLSSVPRAHSTALVFSFSGSPGYPTRYGQVLIDLSRPPLGVVRAAVVASSSSYDLAMPSDARLLGMVVHGQGVVFSGRIQLTNSLEARLGL